jgi:two-component system, LytTR family, response regulator LytT
MTVLIIEDEKLASDKLEKIICEVEPNATITGKCQSVAAAVEWLKSNKHPDVIFSDIRLLDGLSFEIFNQIKTDAPVIFTTAYDQYAIRAFEVNSIDYLLKPVQREKLKSSLDKLKAVTKKEKTSPPLDIHEIIKLFKGSTPEYKSRFMVKFGQKLIALPTEKIAYFYSENKLTFIVAKDGKKYPVDQPLDELIELLDPKVFFKINRQFIITFDSIAEMHPYFKGRIKLLLTPKTEDEVVISSERTPEFKSWVDK